MKISTLKNTLILLIISICISCNSKGKTTISKVEKPNILFLFADDQMFNTIGALNNCPVKTPNLDRLLSNGVSFSHTFNQGSFTPAVCVASRTMLVTGGYLWKAASYSKKGNNINDKNAPKAKSKYKIAFKKPEKYWPQYLKEAGYETYMAGKWHVGEVKPGEIFDYSTNVRPGMPNQKNERYLRSFGEGKPDTWSPYDSINGGYWKGGKHWSEVLADDGISFIEQAKVSNKPFFMYLAFNAPHDPRQAPKEFVDMYPVDKIDVPENFIPEYPYNEAAGAGRKLRDEKLAPFPRTEHSVKVNRQEYYAIISHMDQQIGRILDALEASGKADNTYIFFTADHGLAVGDHGFIGKQNMYDSSMRVPLLMSGPNVPKGKIVDSFVYLQDVMATTLDIAGIEKPEQIDFNTLLPLATGRTDKSSNPVVYGAYFGAQRMYRTEEYKMIVYPTIDVVRLYNMQNDPLEMVDLAENKKEYKDVLNLLFQEYKTLQNEMGDPVDITDAFNNFMAD
ncbi:sulfatase-like hydrolase/transferase [Algibacter miyuki]|uniref:Sulfatase-like hydrolase/transferase n=1 Tax=Algibacter miyuki TaxID=1306933 RepID=A0ABV5H1G2_9FLAO|nr:sulfatase-like hydrolase/transferase [Algibacter miyuki]MDN3667589.1 sulfatase-like hydrolase/transferase [Algibacter miyuki]